MSDRLVESRALHQRVREFARDFGAGSVDAQQRGAAFEDLALAIVRYQRKYVEPIQRLYGTSAELHSLHEVQPLPVDVFRLTRVAAHAQDLDAAVFRSSGTSSHERSCHAFRSLDSYRELSVRFARQALRPGADTELAVLALAAPASANPHSSLSCMMQFFMDAWDPRRAAPSRWFFEQERIDLGRFEASLELLHRSNTPVLLLATSFSLVLLLDALAGRSLPLPPESVIMPTGGTKGKVRAVDPEELRANVARCFALSPAQVVHEYGMTELSSQLYEATLPSSGLHRRVAAAIGPERLHGLYFAPAWLEVTPVDPQTFESVADGELGLARFIDLANIDSALAIVTDDLVRREAGGIRLLGRRPGAQLRGCSLELEPSLTSPRTLS